MKITTYDKLQSGKTAVALGKFQGLHLGHMLLLDKITAFASEEELTSVVFTIHVPSERMIYTAAERFDILRGKGIDVAVECEFSKEFAAMQPEEFVRDILVKKLHAAYVVVGKDFKFGYNRQGDVDRLVQFGIKYDFRVVAFDKLAIDGKVISSSYIRELIEMGDVAAASEYMGRLYTVTGQVVHGRKLGRTIGFPTVNMLPAEGKLLPPYGVYETEVVIDGVVYQGITNIGDNPTVREDGSVSIETHILDYSGNLYDRQLVIRFRRFIRPEIKFHSVDELKNRIDSDRKSILHQ